MTYKEKLNKRLTKAFPKGQRIEIVSTLLMREFCPSDFFEEKANVSHPGFCIFEDYQNCATCWGKENKK